MHKINLPTEIYKIYKAISALTANMQHAKASTFRKFASATATTTGNSSPTYRSS